ncbi:hypothetical protein ACT4VL_10345 [Acinetobacter baumannii]
MDKPMTFNEWLGTQGNLALVHANCCRIAYEAGQQSQQAKVEELQKNLQSVKESAYEAGFYDGRNGTPCEYMRLESERDELQKRVDAAIKCADINFWNANTVEAMVKALKGEG